MTIVCYAGPRYPCQVVSPTGRRCPLPSWRPSCCSVLFAILTAAIGGVTWRFYVTQKEAFERGVQTQLLTIADTKVRQIVEWRKVRLGEARSIMADTFTLAALQRVVEGRRGANGARGRSELPALHLHELAVCRRRLVDPEGRRGALGGPQVRRYRHLKAVMEGVLAGRRYRGAGFRRGRFAGRRPPGFEPAAARRLRGSRFLAACCSPSIPRTTCTRFRPGRCPRAAGRCCWCGGKAIRSCS